MSEDFIIGFLLTTTFGFFGLVIGLTILLRDKQAQLATYKRKADALDRLEEAMNEDFKLYEAVPCYMDYEHSTLLEAIEALQKGGEHPELSEEETFPSRATPTAAEQEQLDKIFEKKGGE